jgi:hypothetical protein
MRPKHLSHSGRLLDLVKICLLNEGGSQGRAKTKIEIFNEIAGKNTNMATKTVSKNIASLVEAVNIIFSGLIEEIAATASKGKIKVDDIMTAIEDSKFQNNLTELIKEKMPKATRKREKKLKDPNAPKKPTNTYLLFCADKREEVKETNPEMKATEITQLLGVMWNNLSEKKKAKYTRKFEEAKIAYNEAMVGYERPSDDNLKVLKENIRRGSKGNGKTKPKSKKDPNAPKPPKNSWQFFSAEKRADVKDANPDMKGSEISKEVGRMWREDFADEKTRKKWIKMATKAKLLYDEEMKEYTPPVKSDDDDEVDVDVDGAATPKKKRGRPTKSKSESKDSNSDNEESTVDDEPTVPVKSKSKSKSKEVVSDDEKPVKLIKSKSKEVVSADEENVTKPKSTKLKAKVEMTMGTAKVVATPAPKASQQKTFDDEDLFGNE